MKSIKTTIALLFFILLSSIPLANSAVQKAQGPTLGSETKVVKKKSGFLKKWVTKGINKIISKKDGTTSVKKMSNLALLFGILALFFLLATVRFGVAVLLVPTATFAILGDAYGIFALRRSRNNREEFNDERAKATIGLILSLLVGILPLALYILVLLSL